MKVGRRGYWSRIPLLVDSQHRRPHWNLVSVELGDVAHPGLEVAPYPGEIRPAASASTVASAASARAVAAAASAVARRVAVRARSHGTHLPAPEVPPDVPGPGPPVVPRKLFVSALLMLLPISLHN